MTSKGTESLWDARAQEHAEAALSAMRDPASPVDDVLAGLALAELAVRISLGERDESEWPDEEPEPVCICPPDLLARGGFKGGCPAHG